MKIYGLIFLQIILLFTINIKVAAVVYHASYYAKDDTINNRFFKLGDKWTALGNSITHQGKYIEPIYLYQLTRFPMERVEFYNCGAGGDTAYGALHRRLKNDILDKNPTVATIMFGVNDIWWQNSDKQSASDFVESLKEIIDTLKKRKVRVALICPPPYDFSVVSDEAIDTKRLGLERLIQEIKDIGKQTDTQVVDFYTPLLNLSKKMQKTDPCFSLMLTDRVHPKDITNFIMGYIFLTQTTTPSPVSQIVVDAHSSQILQQDNCKVKELDVSKDAVTFSVLPESLPYPQEAILAIEDFDSFNTLYNQEYLRIKNIDSGTYALAINNRWIQNFTAYELSVGVNLSLFPNTPQQEQSTALYHLLQKYTHINSDKIRYLKMIEYGELQQEIAVNDMETAKTAVKMFNAENKQELKKYLMLKGEEKKSITELEKLNNLLWTKNKPQVLHYSIKKINQ